MVEPHKPTVDLDERKLIPLNAAVSMYETPILGSLKGQNHIMALSLSKRAGTMPREGLARIITSRTGDVSTAGFIDKSSLYIVEGNNLLEWKQTEKLPIAGMDKVINNLKGTNNEFLGLEDPDVWVDEETGKTHVYFTVAFKPNSEPDAFFYLGHAEGDDLHHLTATQPVLAPFKGKAGFKEVAIAPINTSGIRLNLTESNDMVDGVYYSTIDVVKAGDMSGDWEFVRTALHPKEISYSWCSGHVSPCAFFSRDFLNYDSTLLVGILNGREANRVEGGKTLYGKFTPGLFLYNPETGEIPWVSPTPLFDDPDAKTVTFASEFVQSDSREGILYAHVDDSFVRAYKLNASELRKLLPSPAKNYIN